MAPLLNPPSRSHRGRPLLHQGASGSRGGRLAKATRWAASSASFANAPVAVHDTPAANSPFLAHVAPGALVVGFDDASRMQQICTAGEIFGYIPRSVKLVEVPDLMPAEVYDPKLRAAAEARLLAAPAPAASALTSRQVFAAVVFGAVVFAGFLAILIKLT